MKRALTACVAAAVVVLALAACSDQPEASPTPSVTATYTTQPPLTPPPPVPQSAKVGQAIQVAELNSEELAKDDPEPWSRATITVSSAEVRRGDPAIKKDFWPENNGKYLIVTLRTEVTEGPFIISDQHFELVAPDGTKYPLDQNYFYRQDHFENLAGSEDQVPTPGASEPGSGVLMYSVPAEGVAKGTKLQASLWKGQTFSWTIA
ncbi:hypothetical protein [Flindersiella endophytica]